VLFSCRAVGRELGEVSRAPSFDLGRQRHAQDPLCDLFGIDVPIILPPMGGCTSAELAAAVSNQGGLGGIGSLFRTTAAIKRDIEAVKGLTNRHYAINHIPQMLDAEAVPPEWPCVCTAYRSVSR
jgi:nitronate monooxygenase